jgi:hypothetical protein
VFLHEAGHALFDLLNVPIFGREEDAADQLSSIIMLRYDKERARRLILGSAYQYKMDVKQPLDHDAPSLLATHCTCGKRPACCLGLGALNLSTIPPRPAIVDISFRDDGDLMGRPSHRM